MLSDITDGTNWAGYGRTFDESHYSPLTQINDRNVGSLNLAWSFELPVSASAVSAPLAIDGVLYVATGLSLVRALDAATGRELWTYDPRVAEVAGDTLKPAWGIRGLAWWNGRIFVGTQDGRLISLDARTGTLAWSVQTTKKGDGRYITGAPRVFRGRVIIGHGGADFAPVRGYVTTYDAATGKLLWRFYTVPGNPAIDDDQTTRLAARTWTGQWWKLGGGGTVWNAMAYDPELDRVYLGTGNGAPWNQKIRSPGGGDNLFLCSIVALDARTGKYIWHYQTTPGETWDMNSAMDIELATLNIGGKPRKVILHAPKNGFFYVIDRETGKLVSAKPFEKVTWASRIDLKTGRPIENPEARFPNGEALIWPSGSLGAHNWYAMSFNPKTGLVYIPTVHLPGYYNDKGIDPATWRFRPGEVVNSGFNPITDFGSGASATQSLGALKAWDPVHQRQVWAVPLPGVTSGGVMSTAGNLVFEGRADGRFVAFSADKGKQLWSFDAQNGILAQPITYLAGGRQFVTVIAGFGGGSAALGALVSHFGWDYRTQKRRVLAFVLNGRAKLPPAATPIPFKPVADPGYRADAESNTRGAALFANSCQFCHGGGGVAAGGAPDLRASGAILDPNIFRQIVHDGILESGGMPRFDNYTDAEREDIRQYLRSRARILQQS